MWEWKGKKTKLKFSTWWSYLTIEILLLNSLFLHLFFKLKIYVFVYTKQIIYAYIIYFVLQA